MLNVAHRAPSCARIGPDIVLANAASPPLSTLAHAIVPRTAPAARRIPSMSVAEGATEGLMAGAAMKLEMLTDEVRLHASLPDCMLMKLMKLEMLTDEVRLHAPLDRLTRLHAGEPPIACEGARRGRSRCPRRSRPAAARVPAP